MAIYEFSFASANGRDQVKAWHYSPLGKPRAVIQLIHGYGEHSRRYLHMINAYLQAGFAVYADDHIGHGKTGVDSCTLGDPHSRGFLTYLKDEKSLHDIAVQENPGVPYFVFGHSWGSLLARGYSALYGDDLKAVMLCGICSQMKGCDAGLKDGAFRKAYEENPDQPVGDWFAKIFLGMTERVKNPNGPNDWIASDPLVVADHAADPFNCFSTTLELLYDLVALYGFVENEEWAARVPSRIPFYLISGDQDPCGNYGEGLYHVANLLASSGNSVQVKAYSGYRHEIHNELTLRDEVEAGLISFINANL